nr:JmjC domain-containing protein [Tanacetum cinerariifolium]GFA88193.1 JmjC domain-containing protein [Tanacetum cinerariifolium]
EVPANATMPFRRRRLRKVFTSSASAHVPDNIPAGANIPAATTTIPDGSSMDAAVHSVAAPSSSIPTAADKDKAPMVDDSLPTDLLSKQERVELLAKIATNCALSKQLLEDDVTEDNMNERLGMLLLRKRGELAEQSRVKPMTKTQQRDYIMDFVKNNSASVYNQGWTMKKVKALSIAQLQLEFEYIHRHLERSNLENFRRFTFRPKPTLDAPSAKRANPGVPQVPAASSQVPAGVLAALSFAADVSVSAATTPVVPAVDDSGSDDDPLPYAPYAGWEMVHFPLGSVHAYHDMARHTKHFTTLRELLHMVEKTNLQRLMGAVDNLYQREDPDTFALLLCWRLYPSAQAYILETVDGRVIYMFVDVSYSLTAATLERMLKHGLEVPKLLVEGDLTMAEQLVSFIKAALLTAKSAI